MKEAEQYFSLFFFLFLSQMFFIYKTVTLKIKQIFKINT